NTPAAHCGQKQPGNRRPAYARDLIRACGPGNRVPKQFGRYRVRNQGGPRRTLECSRCCGHEQAPIDQVDGRSTHRKRYGGGDEARALGIAAKMGKQVAPKALRETLLWLADPAGWEKGGENPAVNDKVLAAVQFAAALNELQEPDTAAVLKAAEIVAGSQKPD